jgi:hypothetical protein
MRRVTFSVEPGPDNSPALVLTQMPYLAAETVDQEPYRITLAKNVSLFSVQFWSTNQNIGAAGGEWMDLWPFTNRFPTKVRYALAFDETKKLAGAQPYVINSVVCLPAVGIPERLPANSPGAEGVPGGPGQAPPRRGSALNRDRVGPGGGIGNP